mmetsp:Transcript_4563/g.9308  ORF Transcript_4563/g.9308 Transcript_4563/m.9308 type:complete len:347 (+) Transcript_4563:321-1361(+)
MPRFSDAWAVDKAMFTYISGGSCACCGFPHLFNPGGIEGLIHSMSDLETDAAKREVNAAMTSPWPTEMRDQIWSDRLLLRFKMKREMRHYREFLEGVVRDAVESSCDGVGDDGRGKEESNDDGANNAKMDLKRAIPLLRQFCMETLTPQQLRQIFQLPRSEITDILNNRYKICSSYAILVCSVVEQVANFRITGYGIDARSGGKDDNDDDDAEILFENMLKFEKVGTGFCIDITRKEREEWEVNEDVLMVFLKRLVSLAGPTLLARAPKVVPTHDANSDDEVEGDVNVGTKKTAKPPDDADDDDDDGAGGAVPSFRSDRRVVRLLIARYWADRLIEKYKEYHSNKQ